jgi:hypothetical protein
MNSQKILPTRIYKVPIVGYAVIKFSTFTDTKGWRTEHIHIYNKPLIHGCDMDGQFETEELGPGEEMFGILPASPQSFGLIEETNNEDGTYKDELVGYEINGCRDQCRFGNWSDKK